MQFNFKNFPGLRCQTEICMPRPSQTENVYVQAVQDGKILCPDVHAFIRLSCVHIQNFVRPPDFCAFMFKLLFVHQTFINWLVEFRKTLLKLQEKAVIFLLIMIYYGLEGMSFITFYNTRSRTFNYNATDWVKFFSHSIFCCLF